MCSKVPVKGGLLLFVLKKREEIRRILLIDVQPRDVAPLPLACCSLAKKMCSPTQLTVLEGNKPMVL